MNRTYGILCQHLVNRTYGILCQHLVDQGVPEDVAITATMYLITHNEVHRPGYELPLIKELVEHLIRENEFDWFRWDHTPEGYAFWAQVEERYIAANVPYPVIGH